MVLPIAARFKHNAGIHPKFRGLIIGIAQANHRFLNEEKAIQAAADLLGELFVFSVAGAAIIYEVQRSSRSEARKEEIRRQEVEAIKKREEELAIEVEFMKRKISEMERQYSKWSLPGFRVFGTAQAAQAAARPGTQQPTAA